MSKSTANLLMPMKVRETKLGTMMPSVSFALRDWYIVMRFWIVGVKVLIFIRCSWGVCFIYWL